MSSLSENTITYDDFVDMQNKTDDTLELIDGIVYMSPSPSIKHQEISSFLQGELYIYLKGKKCKVFSAPTDVVLYKDNNDEKKKVVPDLFVACNPNGFNKNEYVGAPDFIIEILSPSNQSHDLVRKLNLYMKYGVKEYWIVNPMQNNILIYALDENNEYTLKVITVNDTATSNVFKDFKAKAKDLFS